MNNADTYKEEHLTDVIRLGNGKFVCVDTCYVDWNGWAKKRGLCEYETIVMPCAKSGEWHRKSELEIVKYKTWKDAKSGHSEIVAKYKGN